MSVVKECFGRLADGREVSLYTIRTDRLCAAVTDLGAVLVRLETPDRDWNIIWIIPAVLARPWVLVPTGSPEPPLLLTEWSIICL